MVVVQAGLWGVLQWGMVTDPLYYLDIPQVDLYVQYMNTWSIA